MKDDWNQRYHNWMDGVNAEKLGRKCRTAKRHEVDKHRALALYRKGLSDLNIAATLGVSKGDVYRWRRLNGLISNMTPKQEASSPSPKTEGK